MATLQEIYNVEPALEAGLRAMLGRAIPGVTLLSRRDPAQAATPRIEVLAELGPAITDERYDAANARFSDEDLYAASLAVVVYSIRHGDGAADHSSLVAQARAALTARAFGALTTTDFPLHAVVSITPSGTAYEASEDDGADVTVLAYDLRVGLRFDAPNRV